jgi:hypothetical protein
MWLGLDARTDGKAYDRPLTSRLQGASSRLRFSGTGQPHSSPPGCRVFYRMIYQIEVVSREQVPVLVGIEACMINRVATIIADRFTMGGAGIEHQDRVLSSVSRENGKHVSLITMTKVEEAIPRQDAVEAGCQREAAHIRNNPFLIR